MLIFFSIIYFSVKGKNVESNRFIPFGEDGCLFEVKIRLKGDEGEDIKSSFAQMGITNEKERQDILRSNTWIYGQDLDEDFMCTMKLVRNKFLSFYSKYEWGSRDLLEKILGIEYIRLPKV
ncbi:MAG: hypothetical protein R2798_07500 [Chitinophagales bacterium]|nr:hypothetical protein [Bacteroidota bacterium]